MCSSVDFATNKEASIASATLVVNATSDANFLSGLINGEVLQSRVLLGKTFLGVALRAIEGQVTKLVAASVCGVADPRGPLELLGVLLCLLGSFLSSLSINLSLLLSILLSFLGSLGFGLSSDLFRSLLGGSGSLGIGGRLSGLRFFGHVVFVKDSVTWS